jgi:hypothetical protein
MYILTVDCPLARCDKRHWKRKAGALGAAAPASIKLGCSCAEGAPALFHPCDLPVIPVHPIRVAVHVGNLPLASAQLMVSPDDEERVTINVVYCQQNPNGTVTTSNGEKKVVVTRSPTCMNREGTDFQFGKVPVRGNLLGRA